jgi:O-antigen/teichoic acid export membrane protein
VRSSHARGRAGAAAVGSLTGPLAGGRIWLAKGIWAATDQGLFACANFSVSVLLARWLSPNGYGAFAVAFSVLMLLGAIHGALLTEPMLVFGPSRFKDRTSAYLRRLVLLHFALCFLMSFLLLLFVLARDLFSISGAVAVSIGALALSSPAVLFLWLMRRACYIESRPRLAAVGGLIYPIVLIPGIVLEEAAGRLSAASALLTMGLASLVVAFWLRTRLVAATERPLSIAESEVVSSHVRYGKWALGSALLSWVPSNIVVLVLPLWYSLEQAATLKVALTLAMPILQLQAALATLLLPALVHARLSGVLWRTATRAQVLFFGMALADVPVVVGLGPWLVDHLFGAQYQLSPVTFWLVAALPLVTSISLVSAGVLRALERPDRVLWTYVTSTAVTGLAGLLLVHRWGVNGALSSLVLAATGAAIVAKENCRRLASG